MALDRELQRAALIEYGRRVSYPYLSAENRVRRDAENAAAWEAEARLYDLNREPKRDDLRAIKRAYPTRLPLIRLFLKLRFTDAGSFLHWLDCEEEETARLQWLLGAKDDEQPIDEQPAEVEKTLPGAEPQPDKDPLELEREAERLTGQTTARVLAADYGIPKSTLGDLLRKWRDAGFIEEAAPQRMKPADVPKARALLELERQKREREKSGF